MPRYRGECGHCGFVATSVAAMESHIIDHEKDNHAEIASDHHSSNANVEERTDESLKSEHETKEDAEIEFVDGDWGRMDDMYMFEEGVDEGGLLAEENEEFVTSDDDGDDSHLIFDEVIEPEDERESEAKDNHEEQLDASAKDVKQKGQTESGENSSHTAVVDFKENQDHVMELDETVMYSQSDPPQDAENALIKDESALDECNVTRTDSSEKDEDLEGNSLCPKEKPIKSEENDVLQHCPLVHTQGEGQLEESKAADISQEGNSDAQNQPAVTAIRADHLSTTGQTEAAPAELCEVENNDTNTPKNIIVSSKKERCVHTIVENGKADSSTEPKKGTVKKGQKVKKSCKKGGKKVATTGSRSNETESVSPYSGAADSISTNLIKRPPSPFMLWKRIERKKLMAAHSVNELREVLRKKWRLLSARQRRPFITEAAYLKCLHQMQYPNYKFKPHKKQQQSDVPDGCQTENKQEPMRSEVKCHQLEKTKKEDENLLNIKRDIEQVDIQPKCTKMKEEESKSYITNKSGLNIQENSQQEENLVRRRSVRVIKKPDKFTPEKLSENITEKIVTKDKSKAENQAKITDENTSKGKRKLNFHENEVIKIEKHVTVLNENKMAKLPPQTIAVKVEESSVTQDNTCEAGISSVKVESVKVESVKLGRNESTVVADNIEKIGSNELLSTESNILPDKTLNSDNLDKSESAVNVQLDHKYSEVNQDLRNVGIDHGYNKMLHVRRSGRQRKTPVDNDHEYTKPHNRKSPRRKKCKEKSDLQSEKQSTCASVKGQEKVGPSSSELSQEQIFAKQSSLKLESFLPKPAFKILPRNKSLIPEVTQQQGANAAGLSQKLPCSNYYIVQPKTLTSPQFILKIKEPIASPLVKSTSQTTASRNVSLLSAFPIATGLLNTQPISNLKSNVSQTGTSSASLPTTSMTDGLKILLQMPSTTMSVTSTVSSLTDTAVKSSLASIQTTFVSPSKAVLTKPPLRSIVSPTLIPNVLQISTNTSRNGTEYPLLPSNIIQQREPILLSLSNGLFGQVITPNKISTTHSGTNLKSGAATDIAKVPTFTVTSKGIKQNINNLPPKFIIAKPSVLKGKELGVNKNTNTPISLLHSVLNELPLKKTVSEVDAVKSWPLKNGKSNEQETIKNVTPDSFLGGQDIPGPLPEMVTSDCEVEVNSPILPGKILALADKGGFVCTEDNCFEVFWHRSQYCSHVLTFHRLTAHLFYCPYCSFVSTSRDIVQVHSAKCERRKERGPAVPVPSVKSPDASSCLTKNSVTQKEESAKVANNTNQESDRKCKEEKEDAPSEESKYIIKGKPTKLKLVAEVDFPPYVPPKEGRRCLVVSSQVKYKARQDNLTEDWKYFCAYCPRRPGSGIEQTLSHAKKMHTKGERDTTATVTVLRRKLVQVPSVKEAEHQSSDETSSKAGEDSQSDIQPSKAKYPLDLHNYNKIKETDGCEVALKQYVVAVREEVVQADITESTDGMPFVIYENGIEATIATEMSPGLKMQKLTAFQVKVENRYPPEQTGVKRKRVSSNVKGLKKGCTRTSNAGKVDLGTDVDDPKPMFIKKARRGYLIEVYKEKGENNQEYFWRKARNSVGYIKVRRGANETSPTTDVDKGEVSPSKKGIISVQKGKKAVESKQKPTSSRPSGKEANLSDINKRKIHDGKVSKGERFVWYYKCKKKKEAEVGSVTPVKHEKSNDSKEPTRVSSRERKPRMYEDCVVGADNIDIIEDIDDDMGDIKLSETDEAEVHVKIPGGGDVMVASSVRVDEKLQMSPVVCLVDIMQALTQHVEQPEDSDLRDINRFLAHENKMASYNHRSCHILKKQLSHTVDKERTNHKTSVDTLAEVQSSNISPTRKEDSNPEEMTLSEQRQMCYNASESQLTETKLVCSVTDNEQISSLTRPVDSQNGLSEVKCEPLINSKSIGSMYIVGSYHGNEKGIVQANNSFISLATNDVKSGSTYASSTETYVDKPRTGGMQPDAIFSESEVHVGENTR